MKEEELIFFQFLFFIFYKDFFIFKFFIQEGESKLRKNMKYFEENLYEFFDEKLFFRGLRGLPNKSFLYPQK